MFATQPEGLGRYERQWSFRRVEIDIDVGQIDAAS